MRSTNLARQSPGRARGILVAAQAGPRVRPSISGKGTGARRSRCSAGLVIAVAAGGPAVPTASDDVHLTATPSNRTIASATRAAQSLDMTGYGSVTPRTSTFNARPTVRGSLTFPANPTAWTIAGTGGTLAIRGTGKLTSNRKTWPHGITLPGANTITPTDDWHVIGLPTRSGGSVTTVINVRALFAEGGLRFNGTAAALVSGARTPTIVKLDGTGPLDASSVGTNMGGIKLPLILDMSGTITVTSRFITDMDVFWYLAGTVVTGQGVWGTVTAGSGQRAYAGGN